MGYTVFAHPNYSPANTRLQVNQFRHDLTVKFEDRAVSSRNKGGGLRGVITGLSRGAARRLRLRLRNGEVQWKALLTLTYPALFPTDGRLVKKHVNTFAQYLRRQEIKYYWALEFQKRGAPHVHMLVSKYVDIDAVKERWHAIAGGGDPMHRTQGLQVDSIAQTEADQVKVAGYLMAYISKASQKAVPEGFENVGRFWGGSRNIMAAVSRVWVRCSSYGGRRALRVVRKWYQAKMKALGYKWLWKNNRGFIAWGGGPVFSRLLAEGYINFKEGAKCRT